MLECTNLRNRGKSSCQQCSESHFPQDWYSLWLVLRNTDTCQATIPSGKCSDISHLSSLNHVLELTEWFFSHLWYWMILDVGLESKGFSQCPGVPWSGDGCRQVGTGIISRAVNRARCSGFYCRLKKRVRAGAGESTCEFTPWELCVLCPGQCRS